MTLPGQRAGASNWRTVFVPVMVGLLSLAGLVSALLLGQIGRYFSWIAVGSPVMIVLRIVARKLGRS